MNKHINITTQALVYNGAVIRERGEMLSLTDMWIAGGRDEAKRPANWARKEGAAFIEYLSTVLNMPVGHIIKGTRGKAGQTFAHWQIGLAYAKYQSPEFHMWCNEVVRERMEGKSVSVANLPHEVLEMIRRDDGISRMLAHKVTGIEQTLPAIVDSIKTLNRNIHDLQLAADARVAVLDYVSVREILDEAKAVQKGRNSVNRRIGYEMRSRALIMRPPVPLRKCPHSGVWLYPRDFAAVYMAERGRHLVRQHNDSRSGQGHLHLVAERAAK